MTVKKRSMIKKHTGFLLKQLSSLYFAVLGLAEVFFAYFLFSTTGWLGFMSGLFAFGAAFLGIELISRKIFLVENVRAGVYESLVWVAVKFFGPIFIIWFAVYRGFSIISVFYGLLAGLFNVSVILWIRGRFDAKNH